MDHLLRWQPEVQNAPKAGANLACFAEAVLPDALATDISVDLTASIPIESSQFNHICKGTNKGTKNKKAPREALFCLLTGGEGGIRTHGDIATTPDFESGTFDHSATSPMCRSLRF